LTSLASGPEDRARGSWHTAREIVQQPSVWPKVLDLLELRREEISRFLVEAGAAGSGHASILLTGAGSSEFVGRAVAPSLRARLLRETAVVPTTHFVTHPDTHFTPGRPALVIHCARSGDSPESLAAWRLLRRARPDVRHLVITCNESGALRREATRDPSALVLVLPPETNDRSLAMTSSFTAMALCAIGLGWLDALPELRPRVEAACEAAGQIIEESSDALEAFAQRDFRRACFLGSDALEGAMSEGALKMLELTAGAVAVMSNSFLGVRHGPQVFIDSGCVVVACLSSEPGVRRYEIDLLRELRRKGRGCAVAAVSARDGPDLQDIVDLRVILSARRPQRGALREGAHSTEVPDHLRVLTDMVACQILAFCRSRALGLAPDNPSPAAVITRVVQGVTIYDT
jgi:tagatose-6-phosphate ketose/aldose isomerase